MSVIENGSQTIAKTEQIPTVAKKPELSEEQAKARAEKINGIINFIDQSSKGNITNLIYAAMDGSASAEEIYYAILRSRGENNIISFTRKNGTSMGINLESKVSHENRIMVLKNILRAGGISPGCKLEIKQSQTIRPKETIANPEIIKFSIDTTSKERGIIKWNIEVDTKNVFSLIDSQGERKFIVLKMTNDKGESSVQSFYQSTGKNSGSADVWFPHQGTYNKLLSEARGEHIVKEPYINNTMPKHFGVRSKENPEIIEPKANRAHRMGSAESISKNGPIYIRISDELGKMDITSKKFVEYDNINRELIKINPDVEIYRKESI